MTDNILKEKSLLFAVRCVNLYRHLCEEKREYILGKQMLRSGTSIGANIREAQCAEANETQYWFEVMYKANILTEKEFESMNNNLSELYAILTSIIKTSKQKQTTNS